MIGALYTSDQRIVDIYRDVSTISQSQESKIPAETVLNYIEMISYNNKSLVNFRPLQKKTSN